MAAGGGGEGGWQGEGGLCWSEGSSERLKELGSLMGGVEIQGKVSESHAPRPTEQFWSFCENAAPFQEE